MSEEHDRHRTRITARLHSLMLTPKTWRVNDDGELEAVLGRWRVVEEEENEGLYADDEGELVASVVGAPGYGNERVGFYLYTDDHPDMPGEVRQLDTLEPVDD